MSAPTAAKGIRKEHLIKSFNGLYDDMTRPEEVMASIVEAAEHKTSRREVKRILKNAEAKAQSILALVNADAWFPPQHKKSVLKEGSHKKERLIEHPVFDSEQIIHHMLMRQLRKIMMPRLYEYACGSIPGRGPLFAARAMVRWRDSYGGKKFYVAELDIRKFYGNVDTEILKAQLSKSIRDKRFLRLLFRVIDAAAPGMPLGFYTSPWLGNFHLTPVDRYIKHELRPDHYLRYADNFFLFSKNKKELHRMISAISDFLARELHTELKGDWQVFRFEHPVKNTVKPEEKKYLGRAINSLGYVIHCDRVTMRKSTLKRARAKGNRMHRLKRCRRIDAAAMVSYMGWFKHTDTYNYYKKHIKPMVSIKQCKKRISKMAKKGAKKHDRLEKGTGQQRNRAGGTGHGKQQHHGIRAEEYPPGAGVYHTGHHRHGKRHPVGV